MRRIIVLVGLVGCAEAAAVPAAAPSASQISKPHVDAMEGEYERLSGMVHWPICEIPKRPGTCGLLANVVFALPMAETSVERLCPGEKLSAPLSKDCMALVRRDAVDQVWSRYSMANRDEVVAYCNGPSNPCSTMTTFELATIRSHNEAIWAKIREFNAKHVEQERNEIERASVQNAERDAAIRANDDAARRRAAAWAAAGQALKESARGMNGRPQ